MKDSSTQNAIPNNATSRQVNIISFFQIGVPIPTLTFLVSAIGKAQAIISEDVLDEKEKARVGYEEDTLKTDVTVPIAALEARGDADVSRAVTPTGANLKQRAAVHGRGEGRTLSCGTGIRSVG